MLFHLCIVQKWASLNYILEMKTVQKTREGKGVTVRKGSPVAFCFFD